MSTPGFTALSALRSTAARGPMRHVMSPSVNHIVPQALPPECRYAQGFTNTTCYGVVLTCEDCCKVYHPGQGYVDHCGSTYVCGACFGFPF